MKLFAVQRKLGFKEGRKEREGRREGGGKEEGGREGPKEGRGRGEGKALRWEGAPSKISIAERNAWGL